MKRRLFLAIGLLALCLPLFVSAGSAGYYPHAIGDFDGTSDYLTRGTGLTGAADGKVGLFSCWLRLDGGDSAVQTILEVVGDYFLIDRPNTNKLRCYAKNSSNTTILSQNSTTTYTASTTWYHLLFSWDLANSKAWTYVNDTSVGDTPNTLTDDNIDYTRPDWRLGGKPAGARVNGALAEFYFALEYLDISVTANRRYFISASGDPVPLGADGSIPTGTAPIIYMKERAKNAGLNFGTGGDFTINGAPLFTLGPVPFFPLTIPAPDRGMGSRMRIH